jgi:hypothetical protein
MKDLQVMGFKHLEVIDLAACVHIQNVEHMETGQIA